MRRELFWRSELQTNGATAVVISTTRVGPGELWDVRFAALYNQSGESVTAQFAIVQPSRNILVSADQTIADGKAAATNILPLVGETEAVGAVVTGAAKNGPVTLVVTGWIITPDAVVVSPTPPA